MSNMLYKLHEDQIFNIIHQFRKRWGGEWDELLSETGEGFMRAVKSYDPAKGKFSTWMQTILWGTLLDFRRNQFRHPAPASIHSGDDWADTIAQTESREAEWKRIKKELSNDARIVIGLLTDNKRLNKPRTHPETRMKNLLKWFTGLEDGGFDLGKAFEEIKSIL